MAQATLTSGNVLLLDKWAWENTPAAMTGAYQKLPPGAYVCAIFNLNFLPKDDGDVMAVFDIDITEGEFSGFFKKRADSKGEWSLSGQFKRYVIKNGKYTSAFKGFVKYLAKENKNFVVPEGKLDPANFIGMDCAFTFVEEEYLSNGETRVTCKVQFPEKIADVRAGKVKVPELIKRDESKNSYKPNNSDSSVFTDKDDTDDVPFV